MLGAGGLGAALEDLLGVVVVQLNADILGVEDRGTESLASVRFHGLIRETEGAAAEPFIEIWNLSKQKYGNEGWLLAGIQQVS